MRDHREVHGLHAFEVDHAGLVGGHQVGHRHHRDRVDRLEAAEARAVRAVADVVVGTHARGRLRGAAGQRDRARSRSPFGEAQVADLLELDQLALRVDDRGDVLLALLRREALEGLLDVVAALDLQREDVIGRVVALWGVGLDRDVVARGPLLERDHAVRADVAVGAALELAAGSRRLAVLPDADDEGGPAAVVEVAVDGVSQVRAVDEIAERLRELAPVRDERRLVERTLRGESDEGGDGSADALDRARAGLDFFDVHTRGQVLRHAALLDLDGPTERDARGLARTGRAGQGSGQASLPERATRV